MKINKIVEGFLNSWDQEAGNKYSESRLDLESRRMFLKAAITSAVLLPVSTFAEVESGSDEELWQTMPAVLLHLLPPSKNTPDADSINAIGYFKSVLQWPGIDTEDKKFIKDGIGWLNGIARKIYKKTFAQLNHDQKEKTLRTVEKSQAGENWLSLMMLYLFEALLTDPVYGGNVNVQGWAWLQHQPGFPHPPANKRYFNL